MVATTVLGVDDRYQMRFAEGALGHDTTYTVTIPTGTFISATQEVNQHFEWDFTTAPAPPPVNPDSTFPRHQGTYNNSNVGLMTIEYDGPIKLGTTGQLCLYESVPDAGGFEIGMCFDHATPNEMFFYLPSIHRNTSVSSRRAWDAAPLRRGAATSIASVSCGGPCLTQSGANAIQLPIASASLNPESTYAGSITDDAVVGSLGQTVPGIRKEQWTFSTLPTSTCVSPCGVTPPSYAGGAGAGGEASGGSSTSSSSIPTWLFAVIGGLAAIILLGGIAFLYNKNKKKKEDDPDIRRVHLFEDLHDDEFDDDEFLDDDDEFGLAATVGAAAGTGKDHGKSARGYKAHDGPLLPTDIPSCDEVLGLVGKLDSTTHALDSEDPEAVAAGLRAVAFLNLPAQTQMTMEARKMTPVTADEEHEITRADVKAAAQAILACEKLTMVAPETASGKKKKINPWKLKAELMQGKVLVQRMKSLGEPLPALNELLNSVWKSVNKNEPVDPVKIQYMVAQAWPEITQLRLERMAKNDHMQLVEQIQAELANSTDEDDLATSVMRIREAGDMLAIEAKVLNASRQMGSLAILTEIKHDQMLQQANPTIENPADPLNAFGVEGVESKGEAKADQVNVEMRDLEVFHLMPADKVQLVQGFYDEHAQFMIEEMKPNILGTTAKLEAAMNKLKAVIPDPDVLLSASQMDTLEKLVKELSPTMIELHAMSPTHAGPQLEKLLVAADRVAKGQSSAYYLEAVIEEVEPQLQRLAEKEQEVVVVADTLAKFKPVLDSNSSDEKKLKKLGGIFLQDMDKIKAVQMGHKKRYQAWINDVPPFNAGQNKPASAEVSALASVVSIAESVSARGNSDTLTAANSEVKRLYRPSSIVPGHPETLARALVAMEKFIHGEIALEEMEASIAPGLAVLAIYQKDMRVSAAKVQSAYDLAKKIINNSRDDPQYFTDDPKLVGHFTDVVYDAWSDVSMLQAEMKANTLVKDMVHIISAAKSDDMSMD